MNKDRTLAASASWLSSGDIAQQEIARTADEQTTTYFAEHAGAVARYLTRTCGSSHDAEELTQEVFLRLYEELVKGTLIENPRAWAFKVAHNLMLKKVRKRRTDDLKHRGYAFFSQLVRRPEPSPEHVLLEHTRMTALEAAKRALPPLERACVSLHNEGLRLREIGEIVGRNPRRVSDALARAIKRMQKQIDQIVPGERVR